MNSSVYDRNKAGFLGTPMQVTNTEILDMKSMLTISTGIVSIGVGQKLSQVNAFAGDYLPSNRFMSLYGLRCVLKLCSPRPCQLWQALPLCQRRSEWVWERSNFVVEAEFNWIDLCAWSSNGVKLMCLAHVGNAMKWANWNPIILGKHVKPMIHNTN